MYRSPYSPEEVSSLVRYWMEMQPYRAKPFFRVRLLDLEVALAALTPALRDAVFYFGIARFPLREAAEILDVPRNTLWHRYQLGLKDLVSHMNGLREEAYEC